MTGTDFDLLLVKKVLRLIRRRGYTGHDVQLLWTAVADEMAGNPPEQPWASVSDDDVAGSRSSNGGPAQGRMLR